MATYLRLTGDCPRSYVCPYGTGGDVEAGFGDAALTSDGDVAAGGDGDHPCGVLASALPAGTDAEESSLEKAVNGC